MEEPKLAVSVDEAARRLDLGRDVVYRLIMSGDLVSYKVGARRLVPVAGLREWVERRITEAPATAR